MQAFKLIFLPLILVFGIKAAEEAPETAYDIFCKKKKEEGRNNIIFLRTPHIIYNPIKLIELPEWYNLPENEQETINIDREVETFNNKFFSELIESNSPFFLARVAALDDRIPDKPEILVHYYDAKKLNDYWIIRDTQRKHRIDPISELPIGKENVSYFKINSINDLNFKLIENLENYPPIIGDEPNQEERIRRKFEMGKHFLNANQPLIIGEEHNLNEHYIKAFNELFQEQ